MAKKRRKPSNRPRTPQQGRAGGTRTADRAAEASSGPAERPRPHGRPERAPQRGRAEKKELARRQRERIRRRIERAQRARRLAWATGIAAVIAIAVFWFTRPDEPAVRPDTLPGELTTEAPWPANNERASERADLIGLPPEGVTQHTHTNLQVFVHGQEQPVPTNVGVDVAAQRALALHTHEDSGTIHVESQTARDFTLGEFFDVWGVRLSATCVGGYCNDEANQIRVFVNGRQVQGDPRDVVLGDQDVVVLTYGTENELPDPIPSSFDFGSVPQ